MDARAWRLVIAATALVALIGGNRASFGLFVGPLNSASGLGLASLSLAVALGQLAIGLGQPFIGALTDRFGAQRVIVAGAIAYMGTMALPALAPWPALVAVGLVAGALAGSAVASNGLLIGELSRALPPSRAGLAVGIAGAGAPAGALLLGPATAWVIARWGWSTALLAAAMLAAVALPLALAFRRRPAAEAGAAAATSPVAPSAVATNAGVRQVLRRDATFWRIALSFGVCGFHVAFLAVHMPGAIERCGLPASLAGPWIAVAGAANVVGSIAVGAALRRFSASRLLAGLYLGRAVAILALLAAPATPAVLLVFALAMGATHMGTLPPTAALISRRYGVARLGTLMGIVMLVHQMGSFAGIWFGGWAAAATGSDTLLWTTDIALALGAAALVRSGRRRHGAASQPASRDGQAARPALATPGG
jgi:MFS family permease